MGSLRESRTETRSSKPYGIRFLEYISNSVLTFRSHQAFVLIITFFAYASYHATRKTTSIVKSTLDPESSSRLGLSLWPRSHLLRPTPKLQEKLSVGGGWAPFDSADGTAMLGEIDVAFLSVYSIGMFFAGHLGDRTDLRIFLTIGMLGTGLCTSLFGVGYWLNIHSFFYFLVVQMMAGLFQSTGWPSVVAVVGNWFGKSKRGLILGIWNSHTSVGNISGSLIASALLEYMDSSGLSGEIPSTNVQGNAFEGPIPASFLGTTACLRLVIQSALWKLSILGCGRRNLVANNFILDSSNSRCGGPTMITTTTTFEGDNETLFPAYYNVSSNENWAISNAGRFSEGSNSLYYRYTQVVFENTIDLGLYQYARLSPGSLRYYGLGLQNGNYTVNLKFAETAFPDTQSWQSVGRRVFDIYLQGSLVWKDFNIKKEAGAADRATEKEQWVMVSQNYLEIHLLWAGKGTCCIPDPGTYGPAISAIQVTPNFTPTVRAPGTSGKKSSKTELLGMGPRPNTFSYAELRTATEDFSPQNKLGQGGFGPVYKGTLTDGRIVAVKQLSVTSHQGKSQFVAEIAAISAVQQRNLVKLYGCCIEGQNRLLVYEYLENKSLDQALFGKSSLHLDWKTRFEICLGTARGLAYLHEESRPRIVHRDVKASNILLDSNLNPKISDFGLAKLYDDHMTHISTRVAGTIGYLAPEYAMRGHLTEKADVFGFGVVALEILSGRSNTSQDEDPEKIYLLGWAWNLYENNRGLELVDETLPEFNEEQANRILGIAFLCIQASPSLRPSMSRVVAMLLGDVEVSTVASKPSYLTDLPGYDTSSFMSSTDPHSKASTNATSSSQPFSPSHPDSSPMRRVGSLETIGSGR
ncbi:hypothetical protein ACLOJK_021352 [Asimina triloba]